MIELEGLQIGTCAKHNASKQKYLQLRNETAASESPILVLLAVVIVAIIFAVFFGEASKTIESFAQGATVLWIVAILAVIGIIVIIYSWATK